MKKSTKNKLAMYKSVSDVIRTNGTIWEGIPGFVNAVEEFNAKVQLLEEKESFQSSVSKGVGKVSQRDKDLMIEKLMRITGALKAFAANTGNEKLLIELHFSGSTLSNASKVNLMTKADLIVKRGNEFGYQLLDFGISPEELSEIETVRNQLNETLKSSRKAIIERKSANSDLSELEKAIDFLLKTRLDSMIMVLNNANPAFCRDYHNARLVIPYGNRSASDSAA